MVFKLVRTDCAEPCKIELPTGKHLIGRGRFLDCDDKRVSRNHGNIEVTDNTVTINALHQNPFFIRMKETKETQILSQNSSVIINNGDKFGLLPDSFWYELIYCASAETSAEKVKFEPECNQDTSSTESGAGLDLQNVDFDSNKTIVNNSPGSPSLLNQDESNTSISDNHAGNNCQETSSPRSNNSNQQVKRQNSTDDKPSDDVKKIKTEVKEEPDTPQQPGDVAGPSNNQQAPQNADDNSKVSPQAPPQNPRPRERCHYGVDCYRRNPQHKAEYSHPADADWGGGERAPCPWGAACRRRHPRHHAVHSHPAARAAPRDPPRDAPREPRRPRKRSIQESASDNSEDDDNDNTVQILQGKRIRKTIYRPSYRDDSESENEEDPYKTDGESDEWQPGASDDWRPSND